jgi:signal transduction histidine kinase
VRQGNCTVELEPGTGPVELKGVPGRLAQVVTNLVANALDASRQRGGGRIRLELCGNGTRVHLRVKDEGCGIPPENLARVFEPMFTSKPFGEGTGLGLSIVHDIVTGHFGGEIHVQSEVGKGTTVDVALPRAEAAPGRGAKVPA